MKILMTGGTGFIGKAFISRYREHQYTVLSRAPRHAKKALPAGVNIIEQLSELNDLNSFDAIINLAGEPIADKRWSTKQKHRICQSRWSTTQALVDLIKKSDHAPRVFLSGSAIGFFGNATNNIQLEETDGPCSRSIPPEYPASF